MGVACIHDLPFRFGVFCGVRVESEVWLAYRALCRCEKVLPSRPIEDFLRLAVENDSATSALRLMGEAVRSRVNGVESYVRVLLEWYTHGTFFISSGEDDVSVEFLLLDALKVVSDSELREQVEKALVNRHRQH